MDKAYFLYEKKSKKFLLKRSLYLTYILFSLYKVDKVIFACNTLTIITLPFVKLFYEAEGVFDFLKPYINNKSIILTSHVTIEAINDKYSCLLIDGQELINALENNTDYTGAVAKINNLIINNSNIILACTHFLKLENNTFNNKRNQEPLSS